MNKIFLINLEKDVDRLKYQELQFKKNNLKFERVNAIYGKDLNENEKIILSGSYFNYLTNTDAMIGCFQSHLNIYKKIVNENLDNVIIMEDDILFNPNINEKIKILNNNLPNNYDIIHLGCDGMSCLYPKLFKINYNKYFYKNSNLLVGTWCYMISNNGARKILKYYENNNVGHIDRAFTENKNIDLFIFKNPLVKHYNNNFYSNQDSLNNISNNEYIISLNTPQFYIRPLNINFTLKNINYYYLFLSLLTIIIICYVIKTKKYYKKYINLFLFIIIILLFISPILFYLLVIYFKYKYYI